MWEKRQGTAGVQAGDVILWGEDLRTKLQQGTITPTAHLPLGLQTARLVADLG